ncbi:AAA domain-containing protein [Methylobacterium sp. UNC300MFChir4.1]|uniref:Wzz/FepE/Etk N-terminal domain-containing protein n=1 Tax=Methylobacterium sp. UNC300MFChir4.1 TaxID=1502747 RepID=UPI0008D6A0A4|nr:Wzz/FepE/Etk N-terminal domain-containing protein [Methylobacterium sp. UNC300MFChir4.1]SEP33150.1 AAA domain-containing protein [Methylobacterium sp. UNC300MFChir4.1]
MNIHNTNRIPPDQSQSVSHSPETTSIGVQDGPLAVISAALKAARRHKLAVAVWVVFCIGCAALYTVTATPFYTATAVLLLEPRRPVGSGSSDGALMPSLDVGRAESELQVLRSERLLANVFNSLQLANNPEFGPPEAESPKEPGPGASELSGLRTAPPSTAAILQQRKFENFAERFTVRRVGQSYVVEVSYTSRDPNLARRVANAAVSAYLLQSIAAKADAAKNGAEFLQGRVNALAAQARSAAAAVTEGTLPDAPTPDADARVIGAALQPLKPSAPRKTLILGLGAMIGLVGGFLAVALLQAFDRRIRTPQDLVQRAGIPCLAVMPEVLRKTAEGRRETVDLRNVNAPWFLNVKFSTGVRDLRTSIQLALSARGHDSDCVIALVGCTPRTGTTLIGLSLARLLQEGGRTARLIDTNIHGAGTFFLTPDSKAGVGASLADLIINPSHLALAKFVDFGGVSVLPSRSPYTAVGTGISLSSSVFQSVIDQMRRGGYVILDLPPLSVSAESRVAARRADVVVIVAEAGRTTVDELSDAVNGLIGAGANVIGAVLNRA